MSLKPIGIVHTEYEDEEVSSSFHGVEGTIEIFPDYSEGLIGLEGFSHIILLSYLNKVKEEDRKVLKVRYRRFLRFGFSMDEVPESGVFASDSPVRPNPIALSILKVMGIEGRFIRVSGLDVFDGTPVLDIKPYTPDRVVKGYNVPDWYKNFFERVTKRIQKADS
ncbi:MAG: tRNA (N6-threonylcarbamoyladenosine(37)-N6)-methyltransferase TrmO [Candidatus Odinarchaeota archaeon]|nr:tRNA (N6-threonylcarbamoyladenosine(37)-N6)-methyltransferase TrmO [Candidatus Odinarchaeota archaeon]